MAAGDVVTIAPTTLTQNSVLDIKPTAGVEWDIQNITFEIPTNGQVALIKTDGTTTIQCDSDSSNGGRFNLMLRCTNSVWYQIKNTSSTAISIKVSYDGIATK